MKRLLILVTLFIFLCSGVLSAETKWKEYKRQHFIVYYLNAPKDFVKTVENAAEEYYGEITRSLGFVRYKGWNWDERAKIFIFDDTDHYVNEGKHAGWSHGIASPKDKVIRTFPAAHGFFDTTLPHELGHIIFREFVGLKVRIPRWFEEGIAMYQEKAKRWGADNDVRKAIKEGNYMSIKELAHTKLTHQTEKEKVNLFYAESASIVNYLISEFGKQRFVRFCRKMKDGMPFESAFTTVYVRFNNLEQFNESWLKSLIR